MNWLMFFMGGATGGALAWGRMWKRRAHAMRAARNHTAAALTALATLASPFLDCGDCGGRFDPRRGLTEIAWNPHRGETIVLCADCTKAKRPRSTTQEQEGTHEH